MSSDPSQLSRFRNHRLGADNVVKVVDAIINQCIDKGLIKSKSIILVSTHSYECIQAKANQSIDEAANRLIRAVKKKNKKVYQELPTLPKLE
ncbi:hypothetical protein [Peribacillus frigoritolerans]|uniref:hypothetical protein n=1 Tax=Peribacillus frigoritolerans TaxID=450367 RepID=UPI0030181876